METIQVVLDKELLVAADRAARKIKANRSALMRAALRDYLRRLDLKVREERDREGYAKSPQIRDEAERWETEAAWPLD